MAANKALTVSEFKAALNGTGITSSLGSLMTKPQMERFKSTLVQIASANRDLMRCDPATVVGAGVKAAKLGLDISPVFGYACIIPYELKTGKITAQFQLMVNGWIQLAYRSGLYDYINAGEVYEDEYRGYDMLSGKVAFVAVDGGYRDQGRRDKIIGFFAAFRLLSGSEKVLYWTLRQLEIHARTYSPSYKANHKLPLSADWKGPDLYGIGIGWQAGWSAMATKTMIKQLLRKWGPLSTEMQEALEADDEEPVPDESGVIEVEYEEADAQDALPDAREEAVDASEAESGETTPESDEEAVMALFEAGEGL